MIKKKVRSTIVNDILQFVVNGSRDFFESYSEDDWHTFILVASEELMSPAIGWRIAKSVKNDSIPESIVEYFLAFRTLASEKNTKGVNELIQIAVALNKRNIKPTILKGFAGFVSGVYPDIGYRVQADIDLLVNPHEFVKATNTLKNVGYYSYSNERENYFWSRRIESMQEHPALISDSTAFGVDLHRRTAIYMSHGEEFDNTIRENAVLNSKFGAEFYTPDPASFLIHVICHSHVQDLNGPAGRLGLRHLLDCICLHERLAHEPETEVVRFKKMLETHKLEKAWELREHFISAVSSNRKLMSVANLRYKFGFRHPNIAMNIAAALRLIRVVFRRPERYVTPEFYNNLIDKLKRKIFPG